MFKNKIKFITLILLLAISLVACRTVNRNIGNNNRRLSTQTRINDEDWNMGRDRMSDGLGLNQDSPLDLNRQDMPDSRDRMDRNINNGITRPDLDSDRATDISDTGFRTNDLEAKISNLPEVDKVRVIVNQDTALVGVRLRGETQNTITNSLRDKIEKILKQSHSSINKVSITTEPKLFPRINDMAREIELGNPIKGFAEEIKDILRSITPDPSIRR